MLRLGVTRDPSWREAWCLLLWLIVLGPIAFETAIGYRKSEDQARRLAETLSIGDSVQRVEDMIERNEHDRLALVKIDRSLWLVRAPAVVGATNWMIWLNFDEGSLLRVAIRIADSATALPAGAPPDKSLSTSPSNGEPVHEAVISGVGLEFQTSPLASALPVGIELPCLGSGSGER